MLQIRTTTPSVSDFELSILGNNLFREISPEPYRIYCWNFTGVFTPSRWCVANKKAKSPHFRYGIICPRQKSRSWPHFHKTMCQGKERQQCVADNSSLKFFELSAFGKILLASHNSRITYYAHAIGMMPDAYSVCASLHTCMWSFWTMLIFL